MNASGPHICARYVKWVNNAAFCDAFFVIVVRRYQFHFKDRWGITIRLIGRPLERIVCWQHMRTGPRQMRSGIRRHLYLTPAAVSWAEPDAIVANLRGKQHHRWLHHLPFQHSWCIYENWMRLWAGIRAYGCVFKWAQPDITCRHCGKPPVWKTQTSAPHCIFADLSSRC